MIHLLYATQDGQTGRIAQRLAARWKEGLCAFESLDLGLTAPDPAAWAADDTLVVLAPIRFGHHLPAAEAFLKKHKKLLRARRLVMISVNVTARKADKNTIQTNPYYRKWVRRHRLTPVLGAVLAGRLEYRLYKTWEKWVIRFIMFLTKGPMNFDAVVDYTPWDKVDALAREIQNLSARKEAA